MQQGVGLSGRIGPPLPVLSRSLEGLRDMRMAAPDSQVPTRHQDLERLRMRLG